MSAGVPWATRVVVLWAASLTPWSAEGAGALLTTVSTVSLGLLKCWFSSLLLRLLLQVVGWDGREDGLTVGNWRLLSFRIEWWSLPFPHPTGKQSKKKTFRDENLREEKPKVQYNRKKCCACSGTVSGQWDLVVESQTDAHSEQPQLLRGGLRYK